MPSILKRDYNTGELLEISEELVQRAIEDRKDCFNTTSRTKNQIDINFHRQLVKIFKLKLREEKKSTQSGLF